jgi:hypothetical protein
VRAIYEKHNPQKLGDVPRILEKYRGREMELLDSLHAKYGIAAKSAPAPGGGATPGGLFGFGSPSGAGAGAGGASTGSVFGKPSGFGAQGGGFGAPAFGKPSSLG